MDKRLLKVEFDHAQSRRSRPRIGFTLSGFDFLNGFLDGTFVSPVTGFVQPIPNSEEPGWQTEDTGRFRKDKLSDADWVINDNDGGDFASFGPDHADQAIKFVGTNTEGVGIIFGTTLAENTGYNAQVFTYSKGTDQESDLIQMFWADNEVLDGGGVGIKVKHGGKIEIYRDNPDQPVWRGSVEGTGYTPGTVQGGSYARPSDEYVLVRVEADPIGGMLIITTSRGGVCKWKPFWTTPQYNPDGTVAAAAQPVLPAKKWGWYVPEGSATVISAPVVYGAPSPTAVSEIYALAEVPTYMGPIGVDVLSARVIPFSPDVLGELVMEDGVTPFDRTTRTFRVKLTFTGMAFVSGVSGSYPRIATVTVEPEGGPYDVTKWCQVAPFGVEDGPLGASTKLSVFRTIWETIDGVETELPFPAPDLLEAEGRSIRVSFVASEFDEDSPPAIVMLDGVGGAPEWDDSINQASQVVTIQVFDRMFFVREARVKDATPFDGVALCQPITDGESLFTTALREGGIRDAELVNVPRIENPDGSLYIISDTPPQIAGKWNFAPDAGELWSDVLEKGMSQAPQWAWGLRPTVNGVRAYVVDTTGSQSPVATFHRTEETAVLDPAYDDNELGAWPLLYFRPHKRIKLPREGNLVTVTGYDPGANKGIQAFYEDAESRNPTSPVSGDNLRFTREIGYADPSLTTMAQVIRLAQVIWASISHRLYTESWPAFLRFLPDGSPVWRTDRVILKEGAPDGTDITIRLSALGFNPMDESGMGLMDETGPLAPVPIRIAEYSGGAMVGLGGSSAEQIARLQRAAIRNGGMRQRGFGRIPQTSLTQTVALS